LRNLAAELAESHEVPKKRAEAMLSDMVGLIAKHLKKGNRLRLMGLGILQIRNRAARMGRNPATGEAIMAAIPTSTVYAVDTIVAEMTIFTIFGSLTREDGDSFSRAP
jgi:nucleoid DNA-binding protein